MSRSATLLVALTLAMPVAVEVPQSGDSTQTSEPEIGVPLADPRSASETRLAIAGGIAYYAFIARGCEGQVIDHTPVHARDGGASIEYRFSSGIGVGARGGVVRDEVGHSARGFTSGVEEGRTYTNTYVNPHVFIAGGPADMGLGWVFHERDFLTAGEGARQQRRHTLNDFSGHLRLGRVERKYFAIEWMESVPLYSGGGYLRIGFGGHPAGKSVELHGGLSAGGPYEGAGVFLRTSFQIAEGTRLGLQGRAGLSGNQPATAISLRLEYRARHTGWASEASARAEHSER